MMKHFAPQKFFVLFALCALSTPPVPAQAQGFKGLRDSISNLWNRNASERETARAARERASSANNSAEALHAQLEKAGQTFLQANAVFLNSRRQIKETEAKIVATRHRIQIVQTRYNQHKKLFGERLAAMQRNGQVGYLNVLLGSRNLSDLSRRAYLYQAISERDATLQNQIKADRAELQRAQNLLAAQWVQRNKFQQAAMRERTRVVQAQRESLARWKKAQNEVYAQLAFSSAKAAQAKEARRNIYLLEAQRARLVAAYERQRQEYSRPEPSRRNSRSYTRRSSSSYRRPARRSYTRRYRRQRVQRRVRTERFVPVEGGVLKPMPIERLETREVMVPQEPSGGVLSEDFVVEDAPN